jgi:hypothetical protein
MTLGTRVGRGVGVSIGPEVGVESAVVAGAVGVAVAGVVTVGVAVVDSEAQPSKGPQISAANKSAREDITWSLGRQGMKWRGTAVDGNRYGSVVSILSTHPQSAFEKARQVW